MWVLKTEGPLASVTQYVLYAGEEEGREREGGQWSLVAARLCVSPLLWARSDAQRDCAPKLSAPELRAPQKSLCCCARG